MHIESGPSSQLSLPHENLSQATNVHSVRCNKTTHKDVGVFFSSEKKLVAETELNITVVTIRKLNLYIVVASSERIDPVDA